VNTPWRDSEGSMPTPLVLKDEVSGLEKVVITEPKGSSAEVSNCRHCSTDSHLSVALTSAGSAGRGGPPVTVQPRCITGSHPTTSKTHVSVRACF